MKNKIVYPSDIFAILIDFFFNGKLNKMPVGGIINDEMTDYFSIELSTVTSIFAELVAKSYPN